MLLLGLGSRRFMAAQSPAQAQAPAAARQPAARLESTQFDARGAPEPRACLDARGGAQPRACRLCARCGRTYFGKRARFCPFDGERLDAVLAEPERVARGTLVDSRYELTELVAQGAMATVHRVRHRVLGRSFALKALRPELCQDEELVARFTREARALASLSHPNIVRINDFGALPSGEPYFVMEYLDGACLDTLIRREAPLEVGVVLEIAAGITEALLAAHRRGIIHRDLKPDNVHVARSASGALSVKVLDFGLARVLGQSRLTRPNMVCGSPEYMSPEQATGRDAGVPSDIYSLGVMLYEMLTGRLPFESDSYVGLVYQHVYAPPLPLYRVLPALTDVGPVDTLVMRCLAKSPEERFASMADFAAMLEALRSPPDELAAPPVSRAPSAGGRAAVGVSAGPGFAGAALDVGVIARWLLLGCVVGLLLLAFADGLREWW
jgi:tRNA A-37 threonylcarbamoyl transferase component Bud32